MGSFTKQQYLEMGTRRESALMEIAKTLGEKHPITKMLDTLAWGRHEWEMGLSSTVAKAITRAAALDGVFHTINLWARDNDLMAQRKILAIWQEHKADIWFFGKGDDGDYEQAPCYGPGNQGGCPGQSRW